MAGGDGEGLMCPVHLSPRPWLTLLQTLSYSRRLLRRPILVVRTLLLGIWNINCSPGNKRTRVFRELCLSERRLTGEVKMNDQLHLWDTDRLIWCGELFSVSWRLTTFSEVAVDGWRLGLTPLDFEIFSVLVVNPLPASALTVTAHSGENNPKW